MLLVIAIIGILASVVIAEISEVRKRTIYVRALSELRAIETALFLYRDANDQAFPADVNRAVPPGLEAYLHNPRDIDDWPDAPFKGSVYDWDNWAPSDLSYPPYEQVYQISIRFCDVFGWGATCHYPNEPWAVGFDNYSALYRCIQGPCRSHPDKHPNHPGHCVNC